MLWQLADLRHLEQSLVSPVAFVYSCSCSVHHHVSVLFSTLHTSACLHAAQSQGRAQRHVIMHLPAAGISKHLDKCPSLCACQCGVCRTETTTDKHQLQPVGGHLLNKGDVNCAGRLDTLDDRTAVPGSRLPFSVRRSHCAHSGASRSEQGRVRLTPNSPTPLPTCLSQFIPFCRRQQLERLNGVCSEL